MNNDTIILTREEAVSKNRQHSRMVAQKRNKAFLIKVLTSELKKKPPVEVRNHLIAMLNRTKAEYIEVSDIVAKTRKTNKNRIKKLEIANE